LRETGSCQQEKTDEKRIDFNPFPIWRLIILIISQGIGYTKNNLKENDATG
jgi:hypothetical protein